MIEFISVFPETVLEIPSLCLVALFTQISVLLQIHILYVCVYVLCSAVCSSIKDKKMGEVVEEGDDLYESGL